MSATTLIPPKEAQHRRSYAVAAWAALALITLLAAVVQLHAITAKSLWLDEGASLAIARLDWFNFCRILWRREMNMVLYYLLLRVWLHFGDSVAYIRGLSVVFGVAAVPAIFLLARKMQGTMVGLLSALLLTVNAFQVRYAQEVRSYSLLVFMVVMSSYCFVRAAHTGSRRDWSYYIATGALASYTHFFAVLVVLSHWLAIRLIVRARIHSIETLGPNIQAQSNRAARLIALWTLPIWIFIATTGAGPIAWIRRPGWEDLLHLLEILAGNVQAPWLFLYLICVAMGLLPAILAIVRNGEIDSDRIVLACWLLLPIVIVLLVSIARPVFAPRYFIICLPAWVVLAATGITSLRSRVAGGLMVVALVFLGVEGVRSFYKADFDIGRNDVRSATAYILEHARTGDAIIFYTLSTRFPYDYYAARSTSTVKPEIVWPGTNSHLGWRDFMGTPSPSRVPEFANGHPRIWMVATSPVSGDPRMSVFQAAVEREFRLAGTQEFPYIYVSLFER
jgi:mannosyltransferase